MKYGYARVSTEEQNPALQLAALQRARCQKVFKDERTGATTKRPALLRCLKALQDGDTLIVWKLDRLARSLRDLVTMLDDFHQRGIHFRSLTEDINTTTPGGRLIFHMFAALAEFERGLIIERTRAGMKAARARGVRPGPKPKLSRQSRLSTPGSSSRTASAARTWPTYSRWAALPFIGRSRPPAN